jgi:hypothetical protein
MHIYGEEWQTGVPAGTPSANFINAMLGVYTGAATANLANRCWKFDGRIVVSTAGTFNLQVNTSVAADTFTVTTGGYIELELDA